jgi:hypothetical protein
MLSQLGADRPVARSRPRSLRGSQRPPLALGAPNPRLGPSSAGQDALSTAPFFPLLAAGVARRVVLRKSLEPERTAPGPAGSAAGGPGCAASCSPRPRSACRLRKGGVPGRQVRPGSHAPAPKPRPKSKQMRERSKRRRRAQRRHRARPTERSPSLGLLLLIRRPGLGGVERLGRSLTERLLDELGPLERKVTLPVAHLVKKRVAAETLTAVDRPGQPVAPRHGGRHSRGTGPAILEPLLVSHPHKRRRHIAAIAKVLAVHAGLSARHSTLSISGFASRSRPRHAVGGSTDAVDEARYNMDRRRAEARWGQHACR